MKYSRVKLIAAIRDSIEQAKKDKAAAIKDRNIRVAKGDADFAEATLEWINGARELLNSDNPDITKLKSAPKREHYVTGSYLRIKFGNYTHDISSIDYSIEEAEKMIKRLDLLADDSVSFTGRDDPINMFINFI